MTAAHPSLALIAGGGSGGHVFPGLAVAAALDRCGWRAAWIGGRQGIERDLVARAGLDFHPVVARPFLGRGLVDRTRALWQLGISALRLRRLVRELGARILLGTGGYVSAPAVLAARWAGRPAVLFEPNAEAGLANRVLSRLAAEAVVAHRSTGERLRCPVEVVGVPVRDEFFAGAGDLATAPPHRLLVVGGSQGARQLNETVPAAVGRLRGAPEIVVTHQTGPADVDRVRAAYAEAGVEAEVVAFLDDMPAAMGACQLLVSRAGAITLAEICAAGRPAVLVPLAQAEGHQAGNARALEEAGAARAIAALDLDVAGLAAVLAELLGDPDRRRRMGAAARTLVRRDAADAIAGLLVDRAEGRR